MKWGENMSKTIFVVDDSGTSLALAEEALEEEYRVITLSSAVMMFGLLDNVIPDLILLDIEMPETTGFHALEHLKSKDSYANIPVIVLTGLADTTNKVRSIELGAVDFIAKPFTKSELLTCVKSHLT